MKEITLIVKYSVKNGMVNDFLTALKNEGFPQIVQNENGCINTITLCRHSEKAMRYFLLKNGSPKNCKKNILTHRICKR